MSTEIFYQLNQSDFNTLQKMLESNGMLHAQKILARARVINLSNTAVQSQIPTPELTNAAMESLLHEQLANIVYFDYRTGKWNRKTYNGHPIFNQEWDTQRCYEMKSTLEMRPEFTDMRLTIMAVKTVAHDKFPGRHQFTAEYIPYAANGLAAVGDIITYNRRTGKYERHPLGSFGIKEYPNRLDAAMLAARNFAGAIALKRPVCQIYMSGYQKTK